MTTEIAVRPETGLTKAGLDHTRDQLLLLENFVRDVLRKGEDYGPIPGTSGKPTLLKPGAINVAAAFNCHAEPLIDDSIVDTDHGFVSYEAHVDLISNLTGNVMARGFGNCNSYESKYRYRWEGQGESRKRMENLDPLDQANTIKKMAIKRAEVDAAMRLPGVARFFTQDLEDMHPEGDATQSAAQDTRYLCPTHNVKWFKRGNMKSYAHPIGETGKWCNMPDKASAALARTKETLDNAISDAQEGPPHEAEPTPGSGGHPQQAEAVQEGFSGKTLGDLWNWGLTLGYKNKAAMLTVLGVKDDALIGDLQEAAETLAAAAQKE